MTRAELIMNKLAADTQRFEPLKAQDVAQGPIHGPLTSRSGVVFADKMNKAMQSPLVPLGAKDVAPNKPNDILSTPAGKAEMIRRVQLNTKK